MRFARVFAASALFASSLALHANSVTFDVNAPSVFAPLDTNVLTGTLVIDTTSGTVLSYSAIAGGTEDEGVFLFGPIGNEYDFFSDAAIIQLLGVTSLKDFTGAGVTFKSLGPNDVYEGTVTAATPEPSSIALLGTGLVGVAGVLKRRYA